jgi:hypothetical protein
MHRYLGKVRKIDVRGELVIFEDVHKGSGQHWEELKRIRTRKEFPTAWPVL